MSSAENGKRLVWLSDEDCVTPELYEKWFAAPADPAESLGVVIGHETMMSPKYCQHVTDAVLRALGVPPERDDA